MMSCGLSPEAYGPEFRPADPYRGRRDSQNVSSPSNASSTNGSGSGTSRSTRKRTAARATSCHERSRDSAGSRRNTDAMPSFIRADVLGRNVLPPSQTGYNRFHSLTAGGRGRGRLVRAAGDQSRGSQVSRPPGTKMDIWGEPLWQVAQLALTVPDLKGSCSFST